MHNTLYLIVQIHELTMDYLSTYKEPITCILYATFNAPELCTM